MYYFCEWCYRFLLCPPPCVRNVLLAQCWLWKYTQISGALCAVISDYVRSLYISLKIDVLGCIISDFDWVVGRVCRLPPQPWNQQLLPSLCRPGVKKRGLRRSLSIPPHPGVFGNLILWRSHLMLRRSQLLGVPILIGMAFPVTGRFFQLLYSTVHACMCVSVEGWLD